MAREFRSGEGLRKSPYDKLTLSCLSLPLDLLGQPFQLVSGGKVATGGRRGQGWLRKVPERSAFGREGSGDGNCPPVHGEL